MDKRNTKLKKYYPTVKKVLLISSVGAFIGGTLIFPGLPILLRGVDIEKLVEKFLAEDEWQEFDERRLRQKLREMRERKLIKIFKVKNQYAVQITNKGKKRLLQYHLHDLKIEKPKEWDGKWRIVTYDVPNGKNRARDAIRETLKRLEFYQLNKSVYIYPYPCQDAVDFLRELYGIGEHVTLVTVGELEGEEAYKEYFNL